MKTNLLTSALLIFSFISIHANAQFSDDSAKTFFVCNAAGTQETVSAFGDASGGTYSFWIDKRNGNAGTAIYGQHLDSLGVPQWTVNGKSLYQGTVWKSGI